MPVRWVRLPLYPIQELQLRPFRMEHILLWVPSRENMRTNLSSLLVWSPMRLLANIVKLVPRWP